MPHFDVLLNDGEYSFDATRIEETNKGQLIFRDDDDNVVQVFRRDKIQQLTRRDDPPAD